MEKMFVQYSIERSIDKEKLQIVEISPEYTKNAKTIKLKK